MGSPAAVAALAGSAHESAAPGGAALRRNCAARCGSAFAVVRRSLNAFKFQYIVNGRRILQLQIARSSRLGSSQWLSPLIAWPLTPSPPPSSHLAENRCAVECECVSVPKVCQLGAGEWGMGGCVLQFLNRLSCCCFCGRFSIKSNRPGTRIGFAVISPPSVGHPAPSPSPSSSSSSAVL